MHSRAEEVATIQCCVRASEQSLGNSLQLDSSPCRWTGLLLLSSTTEEEAVAALFPDGGAPWFSVEVERSSIAS